jgi:DNA-binding response OmpR family regulator
MDAPDHILIVDDDEEIRSLLGQYLVENGLRVMAVGWAAMGAPWVRRSPQGGST